MLAGKWFKKMFEPESKKILIDHERLSYEFTCNMDNKNFSSVISKYLKDVCKYVDYVDCENGKVLIFIF